MDYFKDLIGKKFGRLIVTKYGGRSKSQQVLWLCRCVCGNEKAVRSGHLKNGHTASCGCLHKEKFTTKIHGFAIKSGPKRFYRIWQAMKGRCNRKKDTAYIHYGAKGIKVCQPWLGFEGFKTDLLASYNTHVVKFGEHQTTLDRIDNQKGYEPKNVRWATWTEQHQNQG